MTVHLTCTQAQFESLTEDAHKGRNRQGVYIPVNRWTLEALLVDHARLREAAERAVDVVEPK